MHSGSYQIIKMELSNVVKVLKLLVIFAWNSILNIWQVPESASIESRPKYSSKTYVVVQPNKV